jgi:hypothetical protein
MMSEEENSPVLQALSYFENKSHQELLAKVADLEARIAKVRELCSQDGYTTWDDSMVFAPNGFGAHNSEELKKWEAAHGHDIRLKCYAEFGCQLLVDPEEIIRALDEVTE